MIRLDYYNRLPVRAEHATLVCELLNSGGKFQLKSIVSKTGLTRTQVLCTLQALVNDKTVSFSAVGKTKFYFIDSST